MVDDERDIADFYAHCLAQRGFAVNRAYDPLTGFRLANVVLPDLMLLNFLMPGVNGLQVLAALRKDERTRRIKVIITSARESIKGYALAAGAVDFLPVPPRMSEVWEKIGRALTR